MNSQLGPSLLVTDLAGSRPLLTWVGDAGAVCQVQVNDGDGRTVWDSGFVTVAGSQLEYEGPSRPGHRYEWRVRTVSHGGTASAWSDRGSWDAQPSMPSPWTARWIARPVPGASRIVRHLESDHVDWAEPGESLAQTFTTPGYITALSVDIVQQYQQEATALLRVDDEDGITVAAREIATGPVPWDRFGTFLEPTQPLEPGTYTLRLIPTAGRVGWASSGGEASPWQDDGISPLPVTGPAWRDEAIVEGTRRLGVETTPAPNPVFRRLFAVTAPVARAVLHATALGAGTFTINGLAVSDSVLDPAPGTYDKSVRVRSYDVTGLLQDGVNELRAEVGRGFFAARGASVWAWNLAEWHREPMATAQLDIELIGGSKTTIVTDETWETTAGPVIEDLLYTGVTHDARTTENWTPAQVVAPPDGTLVPAGLPPIRRSAVLPGITTERPGSTVYDFGVVMTGRVRLRLSAAEGTQVVLRYGEYLSDAGDVVCENTLAVGPSQVDRYIAAGSSSGETWEPDFSYKGFRYVQVSLEGPGTPQDLVAVPLYTDVASVGTFSCSDETLTWMDAATARTFRNNLHGIPTDTPVYEKNGWTADAHLVTEAALHHYDLRTTFGRWLDDHGDAQSADGTVPQIVPTPGWGRAMDPAWSASTVLIPWALYWEYGEAAILQRHLPMMRRYMHRVLELTQRGEGIWPLHSWGDWLAPGHSFAPEGPAPTATMMVKHLADRMAQVELALGHHDEVALYLSAGQQVAAAYHGKYWDPSLGGYADPAVGMRQTMNVLPLAFNAVPAADVGQVSQTLIRDLEERTNGHLDCGAIGVKWLLPALSDCDRDDLALTVATQQTRPGWGVWRAAGETLWESWDETARSRNHYFLGSVAHWIHQRVGGVTATSAGWSTFDVQPVLDDRVCSAAMSHTTALGQVRVRWQRKQERWDLEVSVPHGAIGTVRLPDHQPVALHAGEHAVCADPDSVKVTRLSD
ncbi:glycoside hydrolase family 78 protein [Acidothermaceae bacterium B102]|nr:glycoside hydrolase family 78 protein [Acidothermaceae bacterium B102]